MAIDKPYRFEGPDGEVGLRDMFEGRRQLILYHFMFAPGVEGWPDAGCAGCSMFVDQIGHPAHFHARDTTLALVSACAHCSAARGLPPADGLDDPLVLLGRQRLQP